MGEHVKKEVFKVLLSTEDGAALRELARLERDARKDPEVGAGTLLRELGMPRVHERLAELKAHSVRSGEDRRGGERRTDDRRHPIGAAS